MKSVLRPAPVLLILLMVVFLPFYVSGLIDLVLSLLSVFISPGNLI
jgi:hypothetical protein